MTQIAEGRRQRIAVIGAGPAGMAAAHDLALLNYDVTIFEAAAEPRQAEEKASAKAPATAAESAWWSRSNSRAAASTGSPLALSVA